ncbi:MAG: DEAD/DEAH box helicase [Candidatus Sumerlaeota bacterium]|nr:DEAD/DEAH box helicase [Candidatus Sumerlaeota bacterium]
MDSLPILQLMAHGFSPRTISLWEAAGIAELLPLQTRAVREYGFLQGKNLLVLAPTSAGKTFLAELAAVKRLESGSRVIYLVPTKALAEEKGRQFAGRYRPLGFRVAIATRERPETDRLVAEGRFDLLVAVYEKMKAYLVARPELLSQIGLVVVDEIQSLGERGRGEGLDLLLAKIVSSPYKTQFIGLSAVLREAGRLADWLGCDLLLARERPVELREGVLDCATGTFRYRCVNSGEEGEEPLAPAGSGYPAMDEDGGEEAAFALARFLVEERGEQTLLFVPTRPQSRRWAFELAERLHRPPAEEAAAELERLEPTASRDLLLECLRSGAAFHNSDLSADLRQLIERHYVHGAIRLLVSTPTLGQGVNLTGRNVIQWPSMAANDAWTGEMAIVPLSVARWKNQGGRAGRYGLERDFGRSILLASGPDEAERLFRRYIDGDPEPLDSPLRGAPLEGAAMDLAASGVANDSEAISDMLMRTYTGIAHWRAEPQALRRALDEALGRLLEAELLRFGGDGRLAATGLGKAMALHGLRLETVTAFAAWLRSLGPRLPEPFETLVVLCACADGADFPTPLSSLERRQTDYAADARDRLAGESESSEPLRRILWPAGGFTAAEMSALKKAFLLEGWIGGAETAELERRFGILAGTMANLAGHIHWLARAMGESAQALGLARGQRAALDSLAERLPLGLEQGALGLSRLRVEGLSRGAIHSLVREGYDSAAALAGAAVEDVERIVPRDTAEALLAEVARLAAESPDKKSRRRAAAKPAPKDQPADAANFRLVIDPADPGRVWLDGRPVELTPLPYQLVVVLARAVPRVVSRRDLAEALWPDAAVEDQQITHHARSAARAFSAILGDAEAKRLIEVRRGHGLRLTLLPEEVRFAL